MNEEQKDIWEEEIDLREVGRGIARKWYIWIGLPIIVMILVGVNYSFQPQKFRLSAQFIYYDNPVELQETDISSPPSNIIRNAFQSPGLVEEVLRTNPQFTFRGDTSDIAVSYSRGVELVRTDGDTNGLFDVRLTTSEPVQDSKIINNWLNVFVRDQNNQFRSKLRERENKLQKRVNYLENRFKDWREDWSQIEGDSIPQVIQTRLDRHWKTYERAENSPPELREKLAVNQSRLSSIQALLKEEPSAFEFRVPLVNLSGSGVSESLAEQVNQAYANLRQERVTTSVKISSLDEELNQYEKKQEKALSSIKTLKAKLPVVEKNYNRLNKRGNYLIEQLNQYQTKLEATEFLRANPPDRFDVFPAEAPGEPIGQNTRRNTLLAGVVTFLLLFFGIAFWEIL